MAKAKRAGAKTDFTKMSHYCNFQIYHSSQKARHRKESYAHSWAFGVYMALAQQYMIWSELSECLHIPGQVTRAMIKAIRRKKRAWQTRQWVLPEGLMAIMP